MAKIYAVLALVVLQAAACFGQAVAPPAGAPSGACTLSVTGQGTVQATSDTAEVDLTIQTQNATASGAREAAAQASSAVLAAIGQINGMFPQNISSQAITLTPQTTGGVNGTPETITGYEFTSTVAVQISNVSGDLLSNVIDSAISAGGDVLQVGDINFDLSSPLKLASLNQARTQAVASAQAAAQLFAQQLSLTLGRIAIFDEPSPNIVAPQPLTRQSNSFATTSAVEATSTPTPVSVGQQTVSTQVNIAYSIC